jgi:hypothetical protein
MADGMPLSVEVTRALSRCSMTSGAIGLWEGLLLGALQSYQTAISIERHMAPLGAAAVARQLDSFHRSLSRTANMRSALKHWARLSSEGRTFIAMRLRLGEPSHLGFDDLNLENTSDFAVLRDAVGAARRWLGDKPGTEHTAPIRALVRDVARVYQRATGKRPGLSSSETVAGPSYATPFEDLLVAVLTEAGTQLSLEAARSLYRSELRGKPKKARP